MRPLRLVLLAVLLLVSLVAAVVLGRHAWGVARADAAWEAHRPAPITDLGTVRRLEILPLVDWHAARPELRTDLGVSYLVRADDHTILFDLGHHSRPDEPAPLTENLAALGVSLDEVDTIVVSHAHFDHVGGLTWTNGELTGTTFGIGDEQPLLPGRRALVPVPMTYPGLEPEVATDPTRIASGVATTGTIPRKLFAGWIDEQALVVDVEGKGLVVIVGCGHQTLPRLLDRVDAVFGRPVYGVVGGLHYPVPEGRLFVAGGWVDAQRRLGSGTGPLDPLDLGDVAEEFRLLTSRKVGLVAIGGHDSSDEVLARARLRFGLAWRDLMVGEPILVVGSPQEEVPVAPGG